MRNPNTFDARLEAIQDGWTEEQIAQRSGRLSKDDRDFYYISPAEIHLQAERKLRLTADRFALDDDANQRCDQDYWQFQIENEP